MWARPDWTAAEIGELLGRSAASVRMQRHRMGRWHRDAVPLCCKCCDRPVWQESPIARRYGLCKGCYLDEERMRLEDEARAVALKQRRRRVKKAKEGME